MAFGTGHMHDGGLSALRWTGCRERRHGRAAERGGYRLRHGGSEPWRARAHPGRNPC